MKIDKTTAKRLFLESQPWFKEQLIKKYGADFFKKRSFDEIKTFADACEECGTTEEEFNELIGNIGLSDDTVAYEKMKIVVKAINQGWTPDWSNSSQYKYWPYFKLSSGFGFSCSDYYCAAADTAVGSRLCFESEAKSNYAAQQFIDIYEQFLTIKK